MKSDRRSGEVTTHEVTEAGALLKGPGLAERVPVDLTDALRQTIQANDPDIQYVLGGVLIVETLAADRPRPVLTYYTIGDASPWLKSGMVRAYARVLDQELDAGHKPDDD